MKLLIPTDFSENAMAATHFGISAFYGKAELEVLVFTSVSAPQAGAVMTVSITDEDKAKARKKLDKLEAELLETYPDLNLRTEVGSGRLANVVKFYTESYEPDFTIMGTNGTTGLYEKMIGSNTKEVMNLIERPLMVVPHNCSTDKIEVVCMALEEVDADPDKVEEAVELCKTIGGALHVVHFMSQYEHAEPYQFDTSLFAGVKFSLDQLRPVSGKIEENILKFAKRDHADLIAVVPHHKTFFKSIFHHSVTENILTQSDIPLLIL